MSSLLTKAFDTILVSNSQGILDSTKNDEVVIDSVTPLDKAISVGTEVYKQLTLTASLSDDPQPSVFYEEVIPSIRSSNRDPYPVRSCTSSSSSIMTESEENRILVNRASQSRAIADVTNHFRKIPTPPLARQSSPSLLVDGDNNINALRNNIQLRVSFTEIHNKEVDNVTAFLGEESSLQTTPFNHRMPLNSFDESRGKYFQPFKRGSSLEDLEIVVESHPFMIALPMNPPGSDVTEFWSKIPSNAWMMPYIISYSHDDMIRYFKSLPLIYSPPSNEDIQNNHVFFSSSSSSSSSSSLSKQSPRHQQLLQAAFDRIKAPSNLTTPRIVAGSSESSSAAGETLHQANMNDSVGGSGNIESSSHQAKSKSSVIHSSKDDSYLKMSQTFFYDHNIPKKANAHLGSSIINPLTVNSEPLASTLSQKSAAEILHNINGPEGVIPEHESLRNSSSSSSSNISGINSVAVASWRSLGAIYLCRDPNWATWEIRFVYLCDNYLYELSTDGDKIIGYAQLSEAVITRKKGEDGDVLLISCLSFSRSDSLRVTFYVKPAVDPNDLQIVEQELRKASMLTVEDIYELGSSGVLGRGRFNEVIQAKRRNGILAPFAFTNSNSSSPALSHQASPSLQTDHINSLPSKATNDSNTADKQETDSFALKLVSKEIFWSRVAVGKERSDGLIREVIAQTIVCHYGKYHKAFNSAGGLLNRGSNNLEIPIVQIFGAFETIDGFSLELELMEHQDLFEKLSTDGLFSEEEVKKIIAQLIEAIMICSKVGIAHRDVKLSNITFPLSKKRGALLHSSNNKEKDIRIKLADFGMAGFSNASGRLRGRCGTPGYVAPDILRAGVNQSYGFNVDIFSVGVVAYVLLAGYEPFYGTDDQDLIRSNRNVEYEFHDTEWSYVSREAKDWIAKALATHAHLRMKPEEALRHPWLAKVAEELL